MFGVLPFDTAIRGGGGGVEMNPEPPKYPCGICNKNVNWNTKAIQCDGGDGKKFVDDFVDYLQINSLDDHSILQEDPQK